MMSLRYKKDSLCQGVILALLASALLFSVGGCMQTVSPNQRVDYYTLEYEPKDISKAGDKLPAIIKVENFTISPAYDSDKISYRKGNTVSTYNYHRWRANPADLTRYYLTRDLQVGNLFTAVLPANNANPPSHLLEGIVDEFLEIDINDKWYAYLAITFTILDFNEPDMSKKIVFQKSLSQKIECREKHPLAVAQAMAEALKEISAQINLEIYQSIK